MKLFGNVGNLLVRGSSNGRKHHTTIHDVPSDVLMLILGDVFSVAHRPSIQGQRLGWDDIRLDPWPALGCSNTDDGDGGCHAAPTVYPAPTTPTPECLASVCPTWREAMSNMSVFWTSFVIWTGRNPTPLARVRQYLAWSRSRPIDVYVLRRYDPALYDGGEKARMCEIFGLLVPHMHRWRVLCVKCLHASSLPCPRAELVGRADNLVQLCLDFMLDDLDSPAPALTGDFHAPALTRLSMGGAHFRAAYATPYPHLPLPPRLSRLSITDYHSPHAPFPLPSLLAPLTSCTHLAQLQLASLELASSPTAPPPAQAQRRWPANAVAFVDMAGPAIAAFHRLLGYPHIDALAYTRCSAPPAAQPVSPSFSVALAEIASPAAVLRLLSAAQNDRGAGSCCLASLADCAGLTPAVLRALAEPRAEDGEWACPHVVELRLVGCTGFRSADLRAALEARYEAHAATGFAGEEEDEFVVAAVTALCVRGCGELALDDKVWFNDNMERVEWDEWRGGARMVY